MTRTRRYGSRCQASASRWYLASGLWLASHLPLTLQAAPSAVLVQWWLSTADLEQKLTRQANRYFVSDPDPRVKGIEVDVVSGARYQTMLGLGASLEPATCWNLWQLPAGDRARTMERLVDPVRGIGMNLMRICIGTPDFTGDPWYSYDDLPPGETDPALTRFTIEKDRAYILPILRLARQKNPDLLFVASPWSPPGWMKSTGTMIGGHLLPERHAVYAKYFVRFIRAYQAEGIPIHAVTVQNEPGVDRAGERDPDWHYPSCHWTAEQERDFIRDHLGPALRRHGLKTEIWCYDHNYNETPRGDDPGIAYPRTILQDQQAASLVDGVAFHGYAGEPFGMRLFHREFPHLPLYFTEGSVFGVEGGLELVSILRNWASGYNAWVTILDENRKPNNGPFEADRTIITLNSQTREPTEHFDFYLYGQFMKFIQRGADRIYSSPETKKLGTVAFRNPDGTVVLIVVHAGRKDRTLLVRCSGKTMAASIPADSAGTFLWRDF